MLTAYQQLGVADDADDDTIREAYIQHVKRFPPDREPERFQAGRDAYEAIKDVRQRARYKLFDVPEIDLMTLIETHLETGSPRRPTTKQWLQMLETSLKPRAGGGA